MYVQACLASCSEEMTTSVTIQWVVLGVAAVIALLSGALWVKYLPKYRQYKRKQQCLDGLNLQYEELRKRRRDTVFNFFWSVDSDDLGTADRHERDVLEIDEKLTTIRNSYKEVEMGG